MSRALTPQVSSAMMAPEVRPFLLLEGRFAGGDVRLWTGIGTLNWGGRQWQGGGTLLGVGALEETSEVVAQGTTVSLSGVALDMVQIAIAEAQQGLPGRIWLGFLDEGGQVIPDPIQCFAGRLDVPTITDNAESCTVTISYESRLVDLLTPREWRYTHEAQQVLFPGDLGFEFVTSIQEKEITWGQG